MGRNATSSQRNHQKQEMNSGNPSLKAPQSLETVYHEIDDVGFCPRKDRFEGVKLAGMRTLDDDGVARVLSCKKVSRWEAESHKSTTRCLFWITREN
ncbi:hypothetical protein RB195_006455 [Necator americanus]|uniref:Uncharacterized protein n=1 Tax=Necator americanus TaxID=51031 RepID=A0ABR1BVM7_NECAM